MADILSIMIVLFAISFWFYEHSSLRSIQKFNIVLWTIVIYALGFGWVVIGIASGKTDYWSTYVKNDFAEEAYNFIAFDGEHMWLQGDSTFCWFNPVTGAQERIAHGANVTNWVGAEPFHTPPRFSFEDTTSKLNYLVFENGKFEPLIEKTRDLKSSDGPISIASYERILADNSGFLGNSYFIPTTPLQVDENGIVMRDFYFVTSKGKATGVQPTWRIPNMGEIFDNEGVFPFDDRALKVQSKIHEGDWATRLMLLNATGKTQDTAWIEFYPQYSPVVIDEEIYIVGKDLKSYARYDNTTLERAEGNSVIQNMTRRIEAKFGRALLLKFGLIVMLIGLPVFLVALLFRKKFQPIGKALFLKKVGLFFIAVGVPAVLYFTATLWNLGI